jgi:hypothetical protein
MGVSAIAVCECGRDDAADGPNMNLVKDPRWGRSQEV